MSERAGCSHGFCHFHDAFFFLLLAKEVKFETIRVEREAQNISAIVAAS